MKGKARRLLSWVCVLALCMSLLPVTALAVPGSGNTSSLTPEDKYYTLDGREASEENADITLSKQAVDKGDGTYTVTLSATAKRVVTAKPTEVVFVIDGSGSMNWCEERANKDDDEGWIGEGHYHGYDRYGVPYCTLENKGDKDSRWDIALGAIETMMDNLGEEGISYKFVVYKNSYHDYAKEFDSFSDLQSIKPSGGTYLSAGVKEAVDAFKMDNANQVMIIVADGDSGDGYPTQQASQFKKKGGDIYTVGFTFSSNEFNNLSNGPGYYFTANDADQLKLSMEQISENIKGLISDPLGDKVELVGGVKGVEVSYPDSNSTGNLWVTGDTINWTHNKGLNGTVTLIYTVKLKDSEKKAGEYSVALNDQATLNYRYSSWGDNYYSNSVDFPAPVAAVKAATLDIQVKDGSSTSPIGGGQQWLNLDSGNAFNLNDIPDIGDSYNGKWVESVTVTAKDGNRNIENVTIDDLNDPDPYAYTVTITLTDEEPGPVLDPQATPIKVRVMVDGEEMSAGANVGTYVTVSPDQAKQPASWDEASQGPWDPGTFHEESDTVTYDVTYYDCKDISFKATDGYVIEAVDADLVYGQRGCQGITNNNGTVTADNVKGGSTVTVYVRSAYTVEYYQDRAPLSGGFYDDTTQYVAETTALTPTTDTAQNPTDTGYYHVDCGCNNPEECEHKGYTNASGGQPETEYIKTFEQKDEITLPDLPKKANHTVTGWYLNEDGTGDTKSGTIPVSEVAENADNDRVIKFYSESTANTADYTVEYVFLDENGNVIDDTGDWTSDVDTFPQGGDANIGDKVGQDNLNPQLPNTVQPAGTSDNYFLESCTECTITAETDKNVITVTYALDNWNDKDDTETGGDGTPDYRQALIKYVVADGQSDYGQVDKDLDVVTLEEKDGAYSGSATASATASVKQGVTGWAFDNWSWGANKTSYAADLSDTFTAQGGQTYTYTANFAKDTNKDDIPDKYQVFVNFVSANTEQGTVSDKDGATSNTGINQVYILTDEAGHYVTIGDVTPSLDGVDVKAKEGFAFDIWTKTAPATDTDTGVNPAETLEDIPGNTTITFYANFDTDEIGTEDPDKGDGIPDKYEATVTYKVVGGTWSENGTGTVEKVYTLYEKNKDGQWTQIDPVPTIQENDIPKVNDITATPGYMLPGAWDRNPKEQSVDTNSDNNIYTYTLTQQAPSVKVEKSADKTSVKVGETINYTVTVTNNGNVDLAGVAVQDDMMNSTTATVTAKNSAGADVDPVGTWSENTYTITNLPAGVTYTFKYSYTATENDVKSGVSNTVTVDAPDLPEDPDDTVTITVDVLAPAIDIVKTLTAVNGGEVPTDYNAQVGDALTYTITVTNTGNTSFEEITVTDTMWASDKVTTAMLGEDQRIDVSEGQYQYTNKLMPETSIKITYIYTVQSSDIGTNEISNTAIASTGTEEDDPKDDDTVNVRMDDYTVTITPANITIYTGGDGYSGVVTDEDGNVITETEASGLPEPGYHIDLPDAVELWLQEHDVDLEESAANLAEQLAFQYFDENGNIIRNWDLENQGVYSRNSDGTVSRYVYSLSPNTVVGENEGVQVRLAFTDDGKIVTTDNIWMNENTVSASYDMTIYGGGLQQSEIKAVFTARGESITCTVKIGTGHLLVKSVTNEGTTTNGIEASSDAVDADTITAVADENVTYYVNDSEVKVENENDRVQLLVDEVSNGEEFNAAMGADAIERVTNAAGNTLSNAAYDLAYMDLVDTQNGNTVVTMGEDQSLTIYWPVPEDAAEDSAFHVVHYTEMDRQDTTSESELESAKTIMPDTNTTTINGQKYVTFTTESFSPFALVYEKAPDPVASLDVTKTLTAVNGKTPGSSVSVGDTLTYTITVKNGEVALNNVTITDTFTGKGDLNFRLPDGATVSENQDGTYTITLGDLTAGQEVTITATYKVLRADASSDLTNAVKVNGTNPGGGENPTDEDKTPETPVNPYRPPIRPPVDPDKPELNTEDHYAYIVGYEDGSVQPEGDITRAEVATIFFRLLTDESRNEYWSQTNPYSDVSADDWFNNAVSTLTNAGVLDGYEDGTFKPNGNITRAEFATITARFFEATYDGENLFPDIEGHWAQDYINEAANAGIVDGYEDGTFRPQQYITRAEAVTMVNRTIERHPDADHLLDDMITWPDNPETAWYYEQIQEATNSHEYTMNTDDEQNPYEIWTKLLPNRDWSELEKEWSDANDGAGSGEVV